MSKELEKEARELVDVFLYLDTSDTLVDDWLAKQCAIKHCELMYQHLIEFDDASRLHEVHLNKYEQLIEVIKGS